MRWCLYIPNLLVLLALDVEQCCWCGATGVKDASHPICALDEHEGKLQQGLATAGCVAPLTGAETWKIHTGIRRHRWLCRERC